MACNVFGDPITDETLKALPKYKDETISRSNRATEAFNMKSAEGKDVKARNYVGSLRRDWDNYVKKVKDDAKYNDKACVLVLIYNATGDTLTYAGYYNQKGNLGRSPFPSRIANGQWGAFLYVQKIKMKEADEKDLTFVGCEGAVVYRSIVTADKKIDYKLGWHNPGLTGSFNSIIYGEVCAAEDPSKEAWTKFFEAMDKNNDTHYRYELDINRSGCGGVNEGTTGRGVSSIYEAILKG